MKEVVKAYTVDKYLRPIRFQIAKLVECNASVMELGCGNGDLLFKLSDKLKSGVGIDKSEQLIEYASNRIKKEQIKNLEFRLLDLINDSFPEPNMDYSVASLLFHILPWEKAVELAKRLIAASKMTIICGFSKPENVRQKILLWLDQRFTGHYSNFRDYGEHGFTEGLLNTVKNIEYHRIDTFDPVIKIYQITKHGEA